VGVVGRPTRSGGRAFAILGLSRDRVTVGGLRGMDSTRRPGILLTRPRTISGHGSTPVRSSRIAGWCSGCPGCASTRGGRRGGGRTPWRSLQDGSATRAPVSDDQSGAPTPCNSP
jgi:hypothetical protein